jgi:hypothetical protein
MTDGNVYGPTLVNTISTRKRGPSPRSELDLYISAFVR